MRRLLIEGPSSAAARALVVMLPGLNVRPEDFVERGLVASLQACFPATDVLAPAIPADAYLDRNFVDSLRDVVAVAADRGHRRRILVGLSLGAMGALRWAASHADETDGVVLISPFVATPGTIAAVARAGGLAAWPAVPPPDDLEHALLLGLKSLAAGPRPRLDLGYAERDRFLDTARLIAAILPPERVTMVPGGHDWASWQALWRRMLERVPFGPAC